MTPGPTSNDRVLAVVVGHLPPPVHGMAVAVGRLAELLDQTARRVGGRCVQLSTVVSRPRGSVTYHLGRSIRVLSTMWRLWCLRRDRPAVYLSCDAGPGMLYTVVLLAWSRTLGLSCWLHHHSYAYLDQPSCLIRRLILVGGAGTTHLVGCANMGAALRSVSPRPLCITELPILYAVQMRGAPPTQRLTHERVVLGHMSNLSAEKGLRDVFQTFDRLRQRGVATELVLAGPAATPGDAELVDQLVTAAGDGVHYLGPVYGTDRDKFFDAVDIFLFPSRYRHESFGLVAGEALVRGVEIVAYARGCLTSELVAEAGLLLPRTGPFAEPAAAWIADHGRQSKQSFATIRDKRAEAEAKAQAVASEMVLRHHEDMTGFLASSRASWRRVLVDSRMQFDACRRR